MYLIPFLTEWIESLKNYCDNFENLITNSSRTEYQPLQVYPDLPLPHQKRSLCIADYSQEEFDLVAKEVSTYISK